MQRKINPAISFSLLFKAWQASAGLITIPIVVHTLGPVVQGYYYTFASLIALQSFFELGFGIVISVYASHEWYKLRLDETGRIAGEPNACSRIVSLGRFVFFYFGVAALAYLLIISFAGFHILDRNPDPMISWAVPWFLHIAFSAVSLWLMPFLSLMEGCNQVASVAKFRLLQSLLSNAVLWIALQSGCELWSIPLFSAVSGLFLAGYLGITKREFFRSFRKAPAAERISWRHDLLPMQWRLAVQGLFSYLTFPLYTLLAYSYFGPVEAGRMGMTLQVIGGIQSFSLVLIVARAPELALLAASGDRRSLIANWKRASARSLGVMAGVFLLMIAAQFIASEMLLSGLSRILSAGVCTILAAGALVAGVIQCVAVYLRAHKRELLTFVGVTSGLLYGLSAWLLGLNFGSLGIASSYLAVTALFVLPLTLYVLNSSRGVLRAAVS